MWETDDPDTLAGSRVPVDKDEDAESEGEVPVSTMDVVEWGTMIEVKVVNEEAGEGKVYKAEGLLEVVECSGSMISDDTEEVVAVDTDTDEGSTPSLNVETSDADDDDSEVADSGWDVTDNEVLVNEVLVPGWQTPASTSCPQRLTTAIPAARALYETMTEIGNLSRTNDTKKRQRSPFLTRNKNDSKLRRKYFVAHRGSGETCWFKPGPPE